MAKEQAITSKHIIGYSIGACGDYAAYGFIYSFLSFFLNTIAGVSPAMSGVIISTAIAWDAITDPLCGISMDISRCKYGKRRPMILGSVAPLGASIILLFNKIDASVAVKNIYYMILVLVFWTAYTWWNIPYYSLGAVICKTDDERIKMAGIRQVASFIGTFFCGTVVTFLVGKLTANGLAHATAWHIAAIFISIIIVCTILIAWRTTRGCEPIDTERENPSFREFLTQTGSVLKNKPYILLVIAALSFNVFSALFDSNLLYFVTYNLGLNETAASGLYLANTITSIVLIPVFVKLALIWDKKKIYVLCLGISGILMVIAKFVGLSSITITMIYKILISIGSSCYWMFIFNLVYDCIDYDEANTGIRKDGVHMSVYSFLLKLGGAVASLIMGIVLQTSGFDAALQVQKPEAINLIESLFTIYPGIFLLISTLAMFISPLNKKKMDEINKSLERK